jgi:AraC-like DNA-binding protein
MNKMANIPYKQRNQILNSAGIEWFGFRFAGVRFNCCYYYCEVTANPFSIGTHQHVFWEISRPAIGEAQFEVEEGAEPCCFNTDPKSFLMIPPGTSHRWSVVKTPLVLNSWQVRMEAEEDSGKEFLRLLKKNVQQARYLIPVSEMQLDAERILDSVTTGAYPASIVGLMCSGIGRIIIGSLLGSLNAIPSQLLNGTFTNLQCSAHVAQDIATFIESNLHNGITLSDLGSHFHYSGRHLNRIFKENHNVSIGQYQRQRRLELALRWLATSNRSVKDIALSLGFGTASHFCRYIRQKTGHSPGHYRVLSQEAEAAKNNVFDPKRLF